MLYIVFIILIFILTNLLNKKKEFFKVNNSKWENYRLGDIVNGFSLNSNLKSEKKYIKNFDKKYPHSIGDLYIKKTTHIKNKKNNLDVLLEIIDDKLNSKKEEDHITLHLRIGDSIKDFVNNKFIYNKNYATKLEDIKKIISYLKKQNKIVYIFYGIHNKNKKSKHKKDMLKVTTIYLQKIRDLFNENKIKFIEKTNGNPDDDFIKMCNSKIFIKSGGGFSDLISKVVQKKGNKVIYFKNDKLIL